MISSIIYIRELFVRVRGLFKSSTQRQKEEDGSMENDKRVAIANVLPGLEIHPLDPGDEPIEAFTLIKYRDVDGEVSWGFRTTRAPNREELLGALMVQVRILEKELVESWDVD